MRRRGEGEEKERRRREEGAEKDVEKSSILNNFLCFLILSRIEYFGSRVLLHFKLNLLWHLYIQLKIRKRRGKRFYQFKS